MFEKSLFIFTRDIRKYDNLALEQCSKNSKQIVPVFIITDEQTIDNSYFSQRAFDFLINAILSEIPEIVFFKNTIANVIDKVDAVFMSYEVSPYGRKRAKKIGELCEKHEKSFFEIENHYLYHPKIGNGTYKFTVDKPYKVYGAFKKKCMEIKGSPKPLGKTSAKWASVHGGVNPPKTSDNEQFPATRKEALRRISAYSAKKYNAGRDDILADATTKLSPYLSFGVISPREMPFKKGDTLYSELIWRDFFGQASLHFGDRSMTAHSARFRNANKKWENPAYEMRKIRDGDTGVPVIDYSLKQLYEDGWVHNRLRMIFATYIHEQNIDWKWAEKLYAKNLIDYDINSNHWNWAHHSNQGLNYQFKIRKMKMKTQRKKWDGKITAMIKK